MLFISFRININTMIYHENTIVFHTVYNYHDTLLIVFLYIIRSIPDWGCRMRFFPEEIVLEITGKCMVYDQQMKDKKFVSFVIDLSHSRKNNSLFDHATKILLVPHYLTLSSLNLPLSSHPRIPCIGKTVPRKFSS